MDKPKEEPVEEQKEKHTKYTLRRKKCPTKRFKASSRECILSCRYSKGCENGIVKCSYSQEAPQIAKIINEEPSVQKERE